jgi:hypothetical protein
MKKTHLLSVLFLTLLAFSCSSKKEAVEEEATIDEWPEMDAFHMVMAETFHPFKDSANLEPVKTRASELAKAADVWLNSSLPEKVNTPEVKTMLQELKSSSDALAETAFAGPDEEIGAALTNLHHKFHEIQEAWYGSGEAGHEHDKH